MIVIEIILDLSLALIKCDKAHLLRDNNPMHLAQALFFLNTAIWVVLGIFSIVRIPNHSPEGIITAWVVSILMFGNAAAMQLSGVVVTRSGRLGYAFALTVLVVNILLTFTDQVGALDLITLLIDLLILFLLIAGRKALGKTTKSENSEIF